MSPQTRSITYIALLRAVNLMTQPWRMSDLKKAVEAAGYMNVRTYINTGNVVFEASDSSRQSVADKLQKQFRKSLKFTQPVFVLTTDDLKRSARANPLEPQRLDDKQHCHLVFLNRTPRAENISKLKAMEGDEYRFAVKGRVLYYAYDRKDAMTRRRNIDLEKILGVTGTARTWKVVEKLIELASR